GEGDYVRGEEHLVLGLEEYQDLRNPYGVANGLRRMGWLAAAEGDHERAARLLGAAEALSDELGHISAHDTDRMSEVTTSLRAADAADQIDEWWHEGAAMSRDEAIAYALGH
ncbi:MAG: hypothetical protein ACE5MI_13110, partial [Acidimicrobiia bacterium]